MFKRLMKYSMIRCVKLNQYQVQNTMSNGTDTLEFTFDGETDCDEEPTQMLSINGGEVVEVEGSECSNVGQRQGLMLFLLSLIPVWIRKRLVKICFIYKNIFSKNLLLLIDGFLFLRR